MSPQRYSDATGQVLSLPHSAATHPAIVRRPLPPRPAGADQRRPPASAAASPLVRKHVALCTVAATRLQAASRPGGQGIDRSALHVYTNMAGACGNT